MKNLFKLFGIIALAAVIGFTAMGCSSDPGDPGDPDPTPGSGQYAGKDVLGNSYSLYVGSDASRAAVKGDRYSMSVKTRDGTTRTVRGTITDISADGTLTLQPDSSTDEFTAVVGSTSLDSVASGGDIAQIPLGGGETFTPRTFGKINLRAARWSNANDISSGPMHGENYGSGLSVLVKDFPTNVSKLTQDTDRYTITVSGTSDKDLDHVQVEVQGLTDDDEWVYLASYYDGEQITANVPFTKTFTLGITENPVSLNLMDYKEIILQVTNVIQMVFEDHPDWNVNNGTIPANIPDGQIMATISDFNISLKDTTKEALAGNAGDYTFGFAEDGLSLDYRQAVWSLSAENIAQAKKQGAKFEFIMLDVDDIETAGTTLAFIWQDPVRGLWWQDMTFISGGDEDDDWNFILGDGAVWDPSRKKMTIDLSTVINDNQFASSTALNFIVACWWNDGEECANISDLDIAGANIIVPFANTGNMGAWNYGYEEDGISTNYTQAVWHLDETTLESAQSNGAKLEIVFSQDLASRSEYPVFALVWQDYDTERWWPSEAEAGTENENLIIFQYGLTKSGVTYDSTTKKLTIVLETALETYSGFADASDVNILIDCWYGVTTSIDELGIVSANIVSGS